MWRIDNASVGKHWTDSLSIRDADGGEVAVLTRGYEGDPKTGNGCPSWKNAVLIVAAVNAFHCGAIDIEDLEPEKLRELLNLKSTN